MIKGARSCGIIKPRKYWIVMKYGNWKSIHKDFLRDRKKEILSRKTVEGWNHSVNILWSCEAASNGQL